MRVRARGPKWAPAVLPLLLFCSYSEARPVLGEGEESPVATFLIEAQHVVVSPGHVLEGAQVLVRDGWIIEVGHDLDVPDDARRLESHTLCAGFFDAWSSLGVSSDSLRDLRTSAATLTADSLDLHRTRALQEASLRSGVTAVRCQAGQHSDVGGLGVVLQLDPEQGGLQQVLSADANLGASIGLTRGNKKVDPFQRVEQVEKLLSALAAGRGYLEQKIEYRHKLEEWRTDIAEAEKKLEKDFKKAKKARDKAIEKAEEKDKEHKEKKYKEDKQPRSPKFDADKEVLARVVNGELPLVVTAHRAAELRLLLRGSKKFDRLRLIIAGGTEAGYFASELAERGIPVIVWPALRGSFHDDEFDRHDLALAGELSAAGVPILIGSGSSSASATRDLPMLAALAIGHGLPHDKAFEAMTIGAARAFDVADRFGTVEPGKRANLLLLDGPPLSTTTHVQYVLTAGRLAIEPEEN